MPGNSSVFGFSGPFAEQRFGCDMPPRCSLCPCPRLSQGPSRSEAPDKLSVQPAPIFDVQGLIDGFVADPHRLIIWKVELDPVRDLFRAPALYPRPVPTSGFVQTRLLRVAWTRSVGAAWPVDLASEALFDIGT